MRKVWAEIDLSAVAHNLQQIKSNIPINTKVMAIVKANAYGHGAVQVAEVLQNQVNYFGVAVLAEALELRRNNIDKPILILGYTSTEDYPALIKAEVTQTVFSYEQAKNLSQAALALNKQVKIHIKIDTGMGRIGFPISQETIKTALKIAKLPNLIIEGIFTHLANADAEDKTYSYQQLDKFTWVCDNLQRSGLEIPLKHAANSGTIVDLPEAHFDLVRPGIILYGLYPSDQVRKDKIKLQPAMALKAKIVYLKQVAKGSSISYGCTYTTDKAAAIATIPIGYADGYTRLLSNRGVALVKGRRVPVVGRVCMDQLMLDVSDIPGVAEGDEVVLLGKQGEEVISAEELAKLIGTINYELVCMIRQRVPRKYI
ncbi:alanine racemase [Bacillota bacterium LX-D]|nr:alanine racemase [Bacillota bacterium LX-D]